MERERWLEQGFALRLRYSKQRIDSRMRELSSIYAISEYSLGGVE